LSLDEGQAVHAVRLERGVQSEGEEPAAHELLSLDEGQAVHAARLERGVQSDGEEPAAHEL
jgi:hypothetical protein